MGNCSGIPNSDNIVKYSRSSCSHRICDDLCEVILQYLSIEDKIRFECVSQQFQRTVFQRQTELNINYTTHSLMGRMKDIKTIESMLKKFPNITTLYITETFHSSSFFDFKIYFQIIAKNCPYVTKIKLDYVRDSRHIIESIAECFGARLKYFECERIPLPTILKEFSNIQELNLGDISFTDLQDHLFPKLRKLSAEINDENQMSLLNFIRNNPGIKSLSLTLNIQTRFEANLVLLQVSELKNIIHFQLNRHSINNEILRRRVDTNGTQLPSISKVLSLKSSQIPRITTN